MIDPRGHRFGTGVSALLLASFLFSQPLGVAIVLPVDWLERPVRPALHAAAPSGVGS
jgi:hypothetical protein